MVVGGGVKRGHPQERQAVGLGPVPTKTRTHLDEVGVLAVAADDELVDLGLHAELLRLVGRRHVPLGQPRLALPVLEQQEADLWVGGRWVIGVRLVLGWFWRRIHQPVHRSTDQ